MAKYRVRTTDHGPIGGFTADISVDGGTTWRRVLKYVGGGLVSFDSKDQALKAAAAWAPRHIRRFAR